MARKAKINGITEDDTKAFVSRIENLHADLMSERGKYMADCRSIRDDINAVYDEAATKGWPKKAFKAVMKARDLEQKAKDAREDLNDIDLKSKFDDMRYQIGDFEETPLAQAAKAKEGNGVSATA